MDLRDEAQEADPVAAIATKKFLLISGGAPAVVESPAQFQEETYVRERK
jgi:hypothetical protein